MINQILHRQVNFKETGNFYDAGAWGIDLTAAYGAVDLLVVGRFGSTSGLSAVSTVSQVLNLVTFVVIQTAMGITVYCPVSGEKKPEQIGSLSVDPPLSLPLFLSFCL